MDKNAGWMGKGTLFREINNLTHEYIKKGKSCVMDSHIDLIAEIIREKKEVILYGADADALLIIRALEQQYQTKPTYLCDSDKKKWYKTLMDVEILPPEEAIALFPNAFFFIASGLYKFQIIGNLLSSGKVSADRILNYEPVERRRSCVYLESYIVCAWHILNFCCSDFGKNQSPYIWFDGDYELAADKFIVYRDKLISDLCQGVPTPCDGCPCVKEDWYPQDRRILIFNDGEEGICNFRCCYCKSPAMISKDVSNDINSEKLLEIFRARDLLSDELHTIISCGEISVHPKRREIYDSISGLRNTICTNASILDKGIMQLLELGNTELIISVDSGTRDTFRKVKGHDIFDKVCENIKYYSSTGEVRLKYIILPGINDNDADIDGFVSLCKEAGTKLVQVSYDLHAPRELSRQTISAAEYLVDKLSENGLMYRIISDVINNALIV
ncbi:MAG: radical SAM protein, partial [Bacillota bacterium]